jgi:hypothetical protein
MNSSLCHLVPLLSCILFASSPLHAASVFINSPERIGGAGVAVAGAKLRASANSWDMSLDAGGGTSAGNFIQADLGGSFSAPNRTINFTLEHRAGEGLIFRTVEGANPEVTLAWGLFNTPVSGSVVVPTINSSTPPSNFNLLNLQAVAERAGSRVTFTNLLFSSPTLDIGSGAFQSGNVQSSTPGGITQSLIADTSLGDHSWTLSGTVSLQRPGQQPGSDDSVRFEVTAGLAPFLAVVPEPGLLLFAIPVAALLLKRGRQPRAGASAALEGRDSA